MSEEESTRMNLLHAELSNCIKRLSQVEHQSSQASLIKMGLEKRIGKLEKQVEILMDAERERSKP